MSRCLHLLAAAATAPLRLGTPRWRALPCRGCWPAQRPPGAGRGGSECVPSAASRAAGLQCCSAVCGADRAECAWQPRSAWRSSHRERVVRRYRLSLPSPSVSQPAPVQCSVQCSAQCSAVSAPSAASATRGPRKSAVAWADGHASLHTRSKQDSSLARRRVQHPPQRAVPAASSSEQRGANVQPPSPCSCRQSCPDPALTKPAPSQVGVRSALAVPCCTD